MSTHPWGPAWPHEPRLALCLRVLVATVERRWPLREHRSDGWIGDADHMNRPSDHNPDRNGVVCAVDITTEGIAPRRLVDAARKHPSVHYVIWDGTIWQARNDFHPVTYYGPDPHITHVHVSCWHDGPARSSRHPWHVA